MAITDKGGIYREKIDRWFDEHSDEMVQDVLRLISINSVYGAPEKGAPYGRGAADALARSKEMLEKLGIEARIFDDLMLVGEVAGDTAKSSVSRARLGILAHVDVVAANPAEWKSDPFTGVICDADECGETEPTIYGRGAADDKGPAVASMYALRSAVDIARELSGEGTGLSHGVQLLIGSAEEIGSVDLEKYLEKHTPPEMVFSPDANFPVVNIEKGRFFLAFGGDWDASEALPRVLAVHGGATANIIPGAASAEVEGLPADELCALATKHAEETGTEITVRETEDGTCLISVVGTAAHASMPEHGNNAQTALLGLLSALPLAKSPSGDAICALAELFPHGETDGKTLGIACCDDASGELTLGFDVLSLDEVGFAAAFDSRTPEVADSMNIEELAERAITAKGLRIRGKTISRCHHTPGDSELVRTLLEVYGEYTGDTDAKALAIGGGTYVHDLPGGVAFGPELPGTDNRIHGKDEFISVRHLIMSAKMYTMAILRLCS